MIFKDLSVPVVVLQGKGHGGLGIVRSLGSLGVPVYLVDSDPLNPAVYSRYVREYFRWNVEEEEQKESVAFLQSLGGKLGTHAVLLPTTDNGVVFLATNREVLARQFKFPFVSPKIVTALSDKLRMCQMASEIGIPVPQTRFPITRRDISDLGDALRFPLVLKARVDRLMPSCKRQIIIQNKKALLSVYNTLWNPLNVVVQEYIPGPEDNCWIFHGYFNEKSECLAGFTGKKLRQYPAHGGHTCLAICQMNTTVQNTAVRFLKAIGYSGLVDIDIRYDARDGSYNLLDVNPRIGANSRLFVTPSGLDLAQIYYLATTNQPCCFEPALEGRKWIVEDYDFLSSLCYWWDGNLSLREWLSSLQGIAESGYWNSQDPLPFFAAFAYGAAKITRRIGSTRRPLARFRSAMRRALH